MGAGLSKVAEMALGLGQTPVDVGILRIEHHCGLKARQGRLPVFDIEIIAADVDIFLGGFRMGGSIGGKPSMLAGFLVIGLGKELIHAGEAGAGTGVRRAV